MVSFLTSDFKNYHKENGNKIPNKIDNTNNIVDLIKECLIKIDSILFIASSPDDYEKVESYANILFESLKLSGIEFKNYFILDSRNTSEAKDLVLKSDLIFLSGGSTYTQNEFFKRINLSSLLSEFNGVLIGQSAGALNMSKNVFNSPEEMEDSEPIFFEGLGITEINIEPHFELNFDNNDENVIYQRKCIIDESKKRVIYGQCNGSHILINNNGESTIYGETYMIKDGLINKVCENGKEYKIASNNIRKY